MLRVVNTQQQSQDFASRSSCGDLRRWVLPGHRSAWGRSAVNYGAWSCFRRDFVTVLQLLIERPEVREASRRSARHQRHG